MLITKQLLVAIVFQCMEKRNLMEVSGLVTHILQNIKVKQDMMEKILAEFEFWVNRPFKITVRAEGLGTL